MKRHRYHAGTGSQLVSGRCGCGGTMESKYAFLGDRLTKVAVCTRCGRTELSFERFAPRRIHALSGKSAP